MPASSVGANDESLMGSFLGGQRDRGPSLRELIGLPEIQELEQRFGT